MTTYAIVWELMEPYEALSWTCRGWEAERVRGGRHRGSLADDESWTLEPCPPQSVRSYLGDSAHAPEDPRQAHSTEANTIPSLPHPSRTARLNYGGSSGAHDTCMEGLVIWRRDMVECGRALTVGRDVPVAETLIVSLGAPSSTMFGFFEIGIPFIREKDHVREQSIYTRHLS